MERENYYNEILEAVREEIPDILKDVVSVERFERMKTNDKKLTAICVRISETGVAPTIYLDDFFEAYQEGVPAEKIAQHILCMTAEAGLQVPEVESIPMDYEHIADKLTMQMVEGERNKERLKDLIYRPIGNGMVMIPYIEVRRDENGGYWTEVSKAMAEGFGYDIDELLDRAFANLVENHVPAFFEMETGPTGAASSIEDANLMREDFKIEGTSPMYILTNHTKNGGASVLFYPGVQERIGELLGENYYVLPSCMHEIVIVPERADIPPEVLKLWVEEANRTIIPPQEVLSDKVLFFDREKNKLYEPKGRERDGDERGDR